MRELFLVTDESAQADDILVLRTAADNDGEGERFHVSRAEVEEFLTPKDAQEPVDSDEEQPEALEATVAPTDEERAALFSTPLSMRPKEIQERIRAGATLDELASEMAVAASRIEPYVHPVMLERAQMAEAAKQSHPVRAEGTASENLYQILATAFAARGHSLSDATWDAVRYGREPWVVRLTWQSGLSSNSAEWTLKRSIGGTATTEPRDPVAADLIDPNFAQPVRTITAVPDHTVHNLPTAAPAAAETATGETMAADTTDTETAAEDTSPSDEVYGWDALTQTPPPNDQPEELFAAGDLLVNPEDGQAPRKRKRRAVTPHWEDVLLGVRTNNKNQK